MMQLAHAQKREIYEKGYVRVPNVVPRVMVDAALRAINHSLGEGVDPEQVPIFRARSFCPELQRTSVISDLLNKTPALSLAESAIGDGKIQPVRGGQIALRFPTMADPPPPPSPHLDGMYTPTNGVPEGTIRNFTMLLGVALSDVTAPYSGNLTVWPGTHYLYQDYFKAHGPLALLNGMPPVDLPEPEQLLVQAGDIILSHYQVAHGVATNISPHPRYAIYFRLRHVDHDDQWQEVMTNVWREWAGISEFTHNQQHNST